MIVLSACFVVPLCSRKYSKLLVLCVPLLSEPALWLKFCWLCHPGTLPLITISPSMLNLCAQHLPHAASQQLYLLPSLSFEWAVIESAHTHHSLLLSWLWFTAFDVTYMHILVSRKIAALLLAFYTWKSNLLKCMCSNCVLQCITVRVAYCPLKYRIVSFLTVKWCVPFGSGWSLSHISRLP